MKLKTVAHMIVVPIIVTTMTMASTANDMIDAESITKSNINVKNDFQSMTTEQIQIEVEKHSNNGKLSFALGLELIKRWTNHSSNNS